MEKQMNVETQEIDEKKACAYLFLPEDLIAICSSQVEEIKRLNEIIAKQANLIDRLSIDVAARGGRLNGF